MKKSYDLLPESGLIIYIRPKEYTFISWNSKVVYRLPSARGNPTHLNTISYTAFVKFLLLMGVNKKGII